MIRCASQLRPLPIRPRPRPDDTIDSYILRLAHANHLPAGYLRTYLSAPPHHTGQPLLSRLAALGGRTELALQQVLADFRCRYCERPLPQPAARGRPARWCSPACALRAFRDRQLTPEQRTARAAERAMTACGRCGAPLTRTGRGRPARWCSPACGQRAFRDRAQARPGQRADTTQHRD
jgi:hypothetical protein